MDSVRPLNYAPRPSVGQRFSRRLRRFILFAAIVIAALLWGKGILRHAYYSYWEYECLEFQLPPNHVVTEINGGKISSEICVPCQRFAGIGSAQTWANTIFLHEMRLPDGKRLLVLLSFFSISPTASILTTFQLEYMEWNVSLSRDLRIWSYLPNTITGPASGHYKFFAGQPDQNNASHFTFDYDLDGHRHTCDAWLNNDSQLIVSQRP